MTESEHVCSVVDELKKSFMEIDISLHDEILSTVKTTCTTSLSQKVDTLVEEKSVMDDNSLDASKHLLRVRDELNQSFIDIATSQCDEILPLEKEIKDHGTPVIGLNEYIVIDLDESGKTHVSEVAKFVQPTKHIVQPGQETDVTSHLGTHWHKN